MIQKNSRVEFANGIKFYEQDLLYDDYIYSGSSTISVTLDYKNTGFGIALISSTSSTLTNSNAVLLFRIRHKALEVIYKENDAQTILATYNATAAKTVTEDLLFTIAKNNNAYEIKIGSQKLATFNCPYEMNNYYIGYYSNKDNVIKHINIASSVPYGWIINMDRTNGGYIEFYRDAFELKHCNGIAELEQINIPLKKGRYYLKYDLIDSDIVAYIMHSEDERTNDDEKQMLKPDGSFDITSDCNVSLKFKGTKGMLKNMTITTSKYNDYLRTSPDYEVTKSIDSSYLKIFLDDVQNFSFDGIVNHAPGNDHYSPEDYSIININGISYGLYDLNIATGISYYYIYKDKKLLIFNQKNLLVSTIEINDATEIILYNNVNGKMTNFIITNMDGETINITIENTIKKYLPGAIKSPIVVVDEELGEPLDLSGSYRWFYKNGNKHYFFTNTEREYFKPDYKLKMSSPILDKLGTVTVYGIKKHSRFDLDELLHIEKEGLDNIDNCADIYDVIFEENLHSINKQTGEIRLESIDDYQYIVVDYIKEHSYCVNYRYEMNSYEVDIAVNDNADICMYYDNIIQFTTKGRIQEYISSKRYFNTRLYPSVSCYITIGGDIRS